MSTSSKKLQIEIDKTCKKINEGIEEFHDVLEKYNETTNASHREKLEGELKKEIKKLQRLRDQIKAWQASSEIKDKTQLNEARRAIENEMERFKVLEKEMKIKAYSKEGLSSSSKQDPKEKEKAAVSNWIKSCVDKLSTEVDQFEAEIEILASSKKKGKKVDADAEQLAGKVRTHKFHISQLEAILRSLENDLVGPEEINSIKDDVEYYIECHNDDDFQEDASLYDELNLLKTGPKKLVDDPLIFREETTQSLSQEKEKPIIKGPEKVELKQSTKFEPEPIPTELNKTDPMPIQHAANVSPKIQGPSFASAALMGGKPSNQGTNDFGGSIEVYKKYTNVKSKLGSNLGFESGFKYIEKTQSDIASKSESTNTHYPRSPPSSFNNPSFFERFDLDTLFFIFYFQQNTSYQYLSAQELKRQSWRFHKKYLTWFQRHEEPKSITSKYESGTYIYFDFEAGWCQRKKTDFTFEYRFLEDGEIV